jgi:yopX protein
MTIPKIRAWDPELCLMVPDHFLKRTISGSVYEVISPLTGDRLPIAKALYPNNVMQSFHVFDNSEDKVEIHEGDIVQFEDYDPQLEDTYYSLGIVERSDLGLNITNRYTVEVEDLLLGDHQLDVKVVGNIYQNKELLEEYGLN